MRCPYCQSLDTNVIDTRSLPNESCVRRRRECPACRGRFSTKERFELSLPPVKKRDGRTQSYDRGKLSLGISTAVKKLDIPPEAIDRIIDEVELAVARLKVDELPSTELGDMVLKKLFLLNLVAAMRFASVYQRFDDLASFNDLFQRIQAMPSPESVRAQYQLMEEEEG